MSKNPFDYLRHINDECGFILDILKNDLSKDKLIDDEILKRAVVRSLIIIGEASTKIPADYKLKWKGID